MPIYNEEMLQDWLKIKAGQNGFNIQDGGASIRKIPPLILYKTNKKDKFRIQVNPVDFFGYLEVKDSAQFIHALQKGIGRAKSFGCGLLSIARV